MQQSEQRSEQRSEQQNNKDIIQQSYEKQACFYFSILDVCKENIYDNFLNFNHEMLKVNDRDQMITLYTLNQLHMTLMFIGNHEYVDSEEVFHDFYELCQMQYNNLNEHIEFCGYDLFGPDKNILVAKYEASPLMKSIVDKAYEYCDVERKFPEFQAHISIGTVSPDFDISKIEHIELSALNVCGIEFNMHQQDNCLIL